MLFTVETIKRNWHIIRLCSICFTQYPKDFAGLLYKYYFDIQRGNGVALSRARKKIISHCIKAFDSPPLHITVNFPSLS